MEEYLRSLIALWICISLTRNQECLYSVFTPNEGITGDTHQTMGIYTHTYTNYTNIYMRYAQNISTSQLMCHRRHRRLSCWGLPSNTDWWLQMEATGNPRNWLWKIYLPQGFLAVFGCNLKKVGQKWPKDAKGGQHMASSCIVHSPQWQETKGCWGHLHFLHHAVVPAVLFAEICSSYFGSSSSMDRRETWWGSSTNINIVHWVN